MEEEMKKVLTLFKLDLGLTSTARDDYFESMIEACYKELEKKFKLNIKETEDLMLLCDYSAWKYRHRINGEDMPRNLLDRIRNRSIRGRLRSGTIS